MKSLAHTYCHKSSTAKLSGAIDIPMSLFETKIRYLFDVKRDSAGNSASIRIKSRIHLNE